MSDDEKYISELWLGSFENSVENYNNLLGPFNFEIMEMLIFRKNNNLLLIRSIYLN